MVMALARFELEFLHLNALPYQENKRTYPMFIHILMVGSSEATSDRLPRFRSSNKQGVRDCSRIAPQRQTRLRFCGWLHATRALLACHRTPIIIITPYGPPLSF